MYTQYTLGPHSLSSVRCHFSSDEEQHTAFSSNSMASPPPQD